jgi:hypothetical protein
MKKFFFDKIDALAGLPIPTFLPTNFTSSSTIRILAMNGGSPILLPRRWARSDPSG